MSARMALPKVSLRKPMVNSQPAHQENAEKLCCLILILSIFFNRLVTLSHLSHEVYSIVKKTVGQTALWRLLVKKPQAGCVAWGCFSLHLSMLLEAGPFL